MIRRACRMLFVRLMENKLQKDILCAFINRSKSIIRHIRRKHSIYKGGTKWDLNTINFNQMSMCL